MDNCHKVVRAGMSYLFSNTTSVGIKQLTHTKNSSSSWLLEEVTVRNQEVSRDCKAAYTLLCVCKWQVLLGRQNLHCVEPVQNKLLVGQL